jgi:hypothetical protein
MSNADEHCWDLSEGDIRTSSCLAHPMRQNVRTS